MEVGNDDAVALCWAGHARAFFFKEVDRALLLINRAFELDVNLAVAWQRSGWVRGYAGDFDGAIESLNKHAARPSYFARVPVAECHGHLHISSPDEIRRRRMGSDTALRTKPNWMPACAWRLHLTL